MTFLLSFFISLTFAAPCTLQSEPSLNRISDNSASIMSIINGQRVAYNDGPNCYNAALFGKGYISELTYVDPTEFSFYINKFCSETSSSEEPGDIMTLKYPDDTYEHAALAVDGNLIFEKDSTWGKISPTDYPPNYDPKEKARETKERADSSLYKIKTRAESSFFGKHSNFFEVNKEEADKVQFQNYRCRDARDVKVDLTSLSLIPGVQEILNINKKIEALAFSDKVLGKWQEKLEKDIELVAAAAAKSTATGDEGLYLLTKLISLEGQMSHFTGQTKSPYESNSSKYNEAYKKLATAREALEEKQQEQNKSPLAKKVFLSR